MSDIRIKLAKAMRDMSDMVGDLHWMAAKAVEDLTKKDGEIAKRDARIVELEADLRGYRDGAKAEADAGDEARAECRQLRAKLAFFTGYGHDPHPSDKLIELALINFGGKWDGDRWAIEDADLHPFVRSFAAPVSEAKAQGVVMPDEREAFEKWGETLFYTACFERHGNDEYAGRGLQGAWLGWQARAALNAAPVQQVSVQGGLELIKRMQVCLSLDDTEWGLSAPEKYKLLGDIKSYVLAAPAAPAADAGLVEALDYQVLFDAIAAATSVYANGAINISVQAFRAALAAHRANGVV